MHINKHVYIQKQDKEGSKCKAKDEPVVSLPNFRNCGLYNLGKHPKPLINT